MGTHRGRGHFNPLPPCGGRQKSLCNVSAGDAISIHSLRVEGDSSWYNIISTRHRFQSTPSVWRETTLYRIYSTQEDISIHSLRVEGDTLQRIADTLNAISIHSLRVEGDTINSLCSISSAYFNPLPPCGGRLVRFCPAFCIRSAFQSTPSVWRETIDGYKNVDRLKHFNPLPPCGGRLPFEIVSCRHIDFNPLPPCGGRLLDIWVKIRVGLHFNPLPPCGGRQIRMINYDVATHFNPLPPCGGRPECLIKASRNVVFQSTPSVWRETRRRLAAQVFMRNFNPLHPCGGRPCSYYYSIKIRNISIHSIRVEGDRPQRRP